MTFFFAKYPRGELAAGQEGQTAPCPLKTEFDT